MKKFLCVVFGLLCLMLLVGPRAFASRARLMVYGSGDPTNVVLDGSGSGGSYYYESPYSVVYNPALLSQVPNQLLIEKSNEPGTAAQGAVFKSFDRFHAGLILGRRGEAVNYTASTSMRPMEGFVSYGNEKASGGLGISFFERQSNNAPDRDLQLRGGLAIAAEKVSIEPFALYKLLGREKSNAAYPKHQDWGLGTRFVFNNSVKVITAYRKIKIKNDVNGRSRDAFGLGVGHSVKIDEKTSLVYALGFWRQTNVDQNIIPLNMAAETQVLTWLALRGGLEYHFYNTRNETSVGDTTTGRIGLSAGEDKLFVDFVVGSSSQNSGTAAAHLETVDQADSQAVGFDSGFFSAAALRYFW